MPAAPAYLAAAAAGDDSVTLQWEAPFDGGSEIFSYELEMDDGAGGDFALAHRALPGGPPRHTVVGLRSGATYRFRVRAESGVGKGGWSPVCAAATAATVPGPPSAPAKLGCTHTSIGVAWQEPDWDGGAPVAGYEVEYRPKCAGARRTLEDDWLTAYQGPSKTCTLGSLPSGCTFRVRVRAFNAAGAGEYCLPVDMATSPDVPGAPEPPAVTARHQAALALAWGPPEHDGGSVVAAYRLERRRLGRLEELGTGAGRGKGKVTVDPEFDAAYLGPERACEVRDLEPGTRYELRVSAINAQGASGWSPVATVDTRPGLPFTPEPPHLAAASSSGLQLCWAQPYGQGAPVNSYVLQACTLAELESAQAAAAAAAAATAVATELAAAAQGSGDPEMPLLEGMPPLEGLPLPFGTQPPPPPGAPPPLAAANGHTPPAVEQGGSAPSTSAGSDSGAAPAADAAADTAFRTCYHGPDACFAAKGLNPNCEYAFRLRACNTVGASAFSEVATFCTAPAPPAPPRAPALSEPPTASAVALAWQLPDQDHGAAVSGYQAEWAPVLRASRLVGPWRPAYAGQDTACRVEGLKPGRQVQLRVRASNACGWGAWTEPVIVTTAPDVPGAPEAPICSNRTASSVRLKWAPPAEDNGAAVTRYVVELGRGDAGSTAFEPALSSESTSCKLQHLAPGTTYACRVAAVNSEGQGPASAAVNFTTALAPPLPPGAVEAAVEQAPGGPASVTVSWEPAAEQRGRRAACIGYEVEAALRPGEAAGGGPPKPASKTCSAKVTQLSLGALPSGAWDVRVRGVGADGAGHGEWSSAAAVAVQQPAPPERPSEAAEEAAEAKPHRSRRAEQQLPAPVKSVRPPRKVWSRVLRHPAVLWLVTIMMSVWAIAVVLVALFWAFTYHTPYMLAFGIFGGIITAAWVYKWDPAAAERRRKKKEKQKGTSRRGNYSKR